MWKNTAEPDRPQMTIRRTRFACWVIRVDTHTHTHTQNMYYLLLLHYNNGSTNVPECYVIRTLIFFFNYSFVQLLFESETPSICARPCTVERLTSRPTDRPVPILRELDVLQDMHRRIVTRRL